MISFQICSKRHRARSLAVTDWIIGKILYVKDIKGPSGFITFQDICNKIGNSPSRILEHNVVRAAVYTFVTVIMFVIQ